MTGEINSGGFVEETDVHRTKQSSIDTNDSASSLYSGESQRPKIGPPPGTYLVQLPKEQIYRVPPPENAHRYEYLSRQKPNQTSGRRCFCSFLAALLIIIVLAAIVSGILYLVYRPHKPQFSVSGFSVSGINLTSSSPMSLVFAIKVRSQNGNDKLGLIYEKGISAKVFYSGIELGDGELTPLKQPAKNVTEMVTTLRGSKIQLTKSTRKELTESQKKRNVMFGLTIKGPIKFKVGAVTAWTMTVTVDCKITVDKLTASATVMTESCDTGLSLL